MSTKGHTVEWIAWYADGTVYRSRQTAWADLPATGLLVVKVIGPDRYELWCGMDATLFRDGAFMTTNDLPETHDALAALADAGVLKWGQAVPDAVYAAVYATALAWEPD